ncbi:hypothetical protein CDEST_13769 [Colletotrichum destructivum]|uniref:Uncharacterized protein n=1 Tax=Colletotrichum destructivum TaxID=34406 RepID=A0AAX4IZZ7_9PEZI|nr:hypothetical protein CDEST_13769 [Colletotrichum destructivum]
MPICAPSEKKKIEGGGGVALYGCCPSTHPSIQNNDTLPCCAVVTTPRGPKRPKGGAGQSSCLLIPLLVLQMFPPNCFIVPECHIIPAGSHPRSPLCLTTIRGSLHVVLRPPPPRVGRGTRTTPVTIALS